MCEVGSAPLTTLCPVVCTVLSGESSGSLRPDAVKGDLSSRGSEPSGDTLVSADAAMVTAGGTAGDTFAELIVPALARSDQDSHRRASPLDGMGGGQEPKGKWREHEPPPGGQNQRSTQPNPESQLRI